MFSRNLGADRLALLAAKTIGASIMVADQNLNIVYMNDAVVELLREAESDLKKELPQFSVDTLIGSNIDIFHKNPSHQRRMLEGLSAKHRATIKVGQRTFDLLASPLLQADGRRVGFVVEWADATVRLQNLNYAAQASAAGRAQAVIEFNLDLSLI